MEYAKIPRQLIYDKALGDKRIISYISLLFCCWDKKECNISNLAQSCGFSSSNRHTYDVVNQFRSIYESMSSGGYLKTRFHDCNTFAFSSIHPTRSFGIIYKYEYARILEYRNQQKELGHRINHSHLFLLLAYIRLNMEKLPHKPLMHFSMIKTISENTGISSRSVSSAIKTLESLGIIHSETLPRYQDEDGSWHTNIRLFVNMENVNSTEYDWRKETEWAKDLLAIQRNL